MKYRYLMKYRYAAILLVFLIAACGSDNGRDEFAQLWPSNNCDANDDLTIFEDVNIKRLKQILGEPQSVKTEYAANMGSGDIILPAEYLNLKEVGREFQIYEWEENDCTLIIATTQFLTSEKSVTAVFHNPNLVID